MQNSILTKSVFIVALLFAVTAVNVPAARATEYTDQQILDAIVAATNAGMTNADIAAAASSLGVSADDILSAWTNTYPDADITTFQTNVETAYAAVLTVEVPDEDALTSAEVTSVISDTTTTSEQKAATLAAGGVSAEDLISKYDITDTTVIAAINTAYQDLTVVELQGSTYYTTVSSTGTNVYATNSEGKLTVAATFNSSTGNVTLTDGTTVNLASATGVSVSATTAGGATVTTTMDGHSYEYQASMFVAGYQYLSAFTIANDPTATEEEKEAAKTAMDAAVQLANATVNTASGGTQSSITTVYSAANGTLSYGCINSQNTTLSCPVGTSFTSAGTCAANTVTATSGTSEEIVDTTTAPIAPTASIETTSTGSCPDGYAYDASISPPCRACGGGINGNSGCGGQGGDETTPLGRLYCFNGAPNPIACDSVMTASGGSAPSVALVATPGAVTFGQSSKLTWTSNNAKTCTATNGFGVSYTGTATSNSEGISVQPAVTSTYQITCLSDDAISTFSNATITVQKPVITVMTVTPTRVKSGNNVTVSWQADDVTSCVVTRNGVAWKSGPSSPVGGIQDPVTAQTTYVITCETVGSPVTKSATVKVVPGFQEY